MFLASENIDFTGLAHVFLLGGGEACLFYCVIAALKMNAEIYIFGKEESTKAHCPVGA